LRQEGAIERHARHARGEEFNSHKFEFDDMLSARARQISAVSLLKGRGGFGVSMNGRGE
jgi:hypothetical protein